MIDLHTHILPRVDDGVRTEAEAIEFARTALADGIRTVVATPHCREGSFVNERAGVLEAVARLRDRFVAENLGLRLLPGAEVHLAHDLPARVLDGRAPTLADNGKTLLLELSLSQYPVEIETVVFQLRLAGVIVILAHPERIRYFQDDPRRYETLVRQGAFGQVTTGSLLGQFGDATREFSEDLVRRRLVHVLASDAHNVRGRPPVLRSALAKVTEIVGPALSARMVEDHPRALLNGTVPEVPGPLEAGAKTWSFLGRWFGR